MTLRGFSEERGSGARDTAHYTGLLRTRNFAWDPAQSGWENAAVQGHISAAGRVCLQA